MFSAIREAIYDIYERSAALKLEPILNSNILRDRSLFILRLGLKRKAYLGNYFYYLTLCSTKIIVTQPIYSY